MLELGEPRVSRGEKGPGWAISIFEMEMLVNNLWVGIEENYCEVLPISLLLIHVARGLGLVMACALMTRAESWQETEGGYVG